MMRPGHQCSRPTLRPTAKETVVDGLLAAKKACNVTFDQVAEAIGLTNVATTNIFYRQGRLFPAMAPKMAAICPNLTDDQIKTMQKLPFRSFDPQILQVGLILSECW
jgi:cyanate lyase